MGGIVRTAWRDIGKAFIWPWHIGVQLTAVVIPSNNSNSLPHIRIEVAARCTSNPSGIFLMPPLSVVDPTQSLYVRTVKGSQQNPQRWDRKSLEEVETSNIFVKSNYQEPRVHTLWSSNSISRTSQQQPSLNNGTNSIFYFLLPSFLNVN